MEPCQNYQTQITTKNARVHSCTSYNKLIFYRTWTIVHKKKKNYVLNKGKKEKKQLTIGEKLRLKIRTTCIIPDQHQ